MVRTLCWSGVSMLLVMCALPGALRGQTGEAPAVRTLPCTVIGDEPGQVQLACPGAPPTASLPAIVRQTCLARTGDDVMAIVGPHPPIVLKNLSAPLGDRCFGEYKVAVEGGCTQSELYCRADDSFDQIPCARCGWIETYSCDGRLKQRSSDSCTYCNGRVIPGVVRGPQEGWGGGIPWETVVGRRYYDSCGIAPAMPGDSERRPIPEFADAVRDAWEDYTSADHQTGAEAQAAAAAAHDLPLYDYLTGLARLREAGRPVAFVRAKLAEVEEELSRTNDEGERNRLEQRRSAWLEWTTPERLELLAENPGEMYKLAPIIDSRTAMDPADLERMPPEVREQLERSLSVPIPEALQGSPRPDGPAAADLAFLWERWTDFEAMVRLLR